jgi:hypothetical protein
MPAAAAAASSLVARVDALEMHKVVHVAYGADHALAITDKVRGCDMKLVQCVVVVITPARFSCHQA